jgi:hypothetical protein
MGMNPAHRAQLARFSFPKIQLQIFIFFHLMFLMSQQRCFEDIHVAQENKRLCLDKQRCSHNRKHLTASSGCNQVGHALNVELKEHKTQSGVMPPHQHM